jgi:hypothetical protein
MPTTTYLLADGTKIPGVTTVIGSSLGWNRGALMYWAWMEGKAGRDFRKTQSDAADTGTIAHAMVEAAIRGQSYTPPATATDEQLRAARLSFGAWDEWASNSKLEVLATEIHLISETHRVGGTPDAIGRVRGGLCLPDWKTSKGIYAEHVIQLAAYEQIWTEVTDMPLTAGIHCCRFDKVTGGFSHHWFPSEALRPAWQAFLRLRDLYDLQKPLKALAA